MSLLRALPRSFQTRQPLLLRTFLTTRPLLSEEATTPTVLSTLQPDLKTAMRSKDKPRLSVLRALLAEITNASKTASPISSDGAFHQLLVRQIKASTSALDEFSTAKREDLVEKERIQLGVLEEYRGRFNFVREQEMEDIVRALVSEEREKDKGKWENLVGKAREGKLVGRSMAVVGKDRPVDMSVLKSVIERVLTENA
ncbi:GatB/YqeY domain-containing protein [Massarina eburnea CBS 473.64]|uniref:Altered inheritance of mitochondria protein 41 n=1 Tax=Massarina eburnea CBS 473.64 TaxID=1395130 RepID=A0A6A6RQG3_9PLEO|nr:GatB/YqeY domain-containing protein [Massarina eburnea CBS 473.64]